MTGKKAANTMKLTSRRPSPALSKKLDNLADVLLAGQGRTEQAIMSLSQQMNDRFSEVATVVGELKSQVNQHSAELDCLKADVSRANEELRNLRARMAQLETEGTSAATAFSKDSSNSGSSMEKLAREFSLRAEKAKEKVLCFPATATAGTKERAIKQILNKPEVAATWSGNDGRQFILLRWANTHAAHTAFPQGLFNSLRKQSIYVNASLTPQERERERSISAPVAKLFKKDPRMGAHYSGNRVTAFELDDRSSKVTIDTSAYTKEALPTSLRDPRLQAQLRAARATAAQQPTAPAASAAPAPAAPAAAPAPAAPAAAATATKAATQATAPARTTRASARKDPQPAAELSSDESDSEEEALVSRRAAKPKPKQQPKQQKQQQKQQTAEPKRQAAASPATATKPPHKRFNHADLPLSNRYSAFDDILGDGDQAGEGTSGEAQAQHGAA